MTVTHEMLLPNKFMNSYVEKNGRWIVANSFPARVNSRTKMFVITLDQTSIQIRFKHAMTINNPDDLHRAIRSGSARILRPHTIDDMRRDEDARSAHMFPVSMKRGESIAIYNLGLSQFTVGHDVVFNSLTDVRRFVEEAEGIPEIGLVHNEFRANARKDGQVRDKDCDEGERTDNGGAGHKAV